MIGFGADARSDEPASRRKGPSSERLALAVFVSLVILAVPLYLRLGDQQWFFFDEWDFLAGRNPASVDDLLRPHNEHWSTLPILVYRALFRYFGLNTYVPYQLCVIVLHLAAAVLLRVIMRRAGVGPWLATAAASLFVLFGEGRANIIWGFQIGFTGALVFGLAHLLLADHDGPFSRRDGLGLACGFVGLLCSGVAVPMTFAVGLAVLIRRGWRAAAVHTVPLALVYAVWYGVYGRESYGELDPDPASIVSFTGTGVANVFARLGQVNPMAVVLVVVLVVGLALRLFWPDPAEGPRRSLAAPLSLLAALLVYFIVSGAGRASLGDEFAKADRYAHLGAALTISALAVAAEAIRRRRPVLLLPLIAMLMVGIPGNVDAVRVDTRTGARRILGPKTTILSIAHTPTLDLVPRDVHPYPCPLGGAQEVTVGWLQDGAESGRIPEPEEQRAQDVAAANVALLLEECRHFAGASCTEIESATRRSLNRGDSVAFPRGRAQIRLVVDDDVASAVWLLHSSGRPLTARIDGVTVDIRPAPNEPTIEICS